MNQGTVDISDIYSLKIVYVLYVDISLSFIKKWLTNKRNSRPLIVPDFQTVWISLSLTSPLLFKNDVGYLSRMIKWWNTKL